MSICAEYSGVVFDQNKATGSFEPGTSQYYQSFHLPENYLRGSKPEQYEYPSISGIQLLAEVPSEEELKVEVDFTIEQQFFGNPNWEVLGKGTAKGAQADGKVWVDGFLAREVPVTAEMTSDIAALRIGFKVVAGIQTLFYAEPNPLVFAEALQSDGSTPLRGKGAKAVSFSFRLLGLVADAGTDFLGDPYRSVVVHSEAQAPAGENTNAGFWLSGPQPSKFAVVSHYSDLRVFPEVTSYGEINAVVNPSFEYDKLEGEPYGWSVIPPIYLPEDQVENYVQIHGGAPSEVEYQQTFHALLPFQSYKTGASLKVIEAIEPPDGKQVLEVKTSGPELSAPKTTIDSYDAEGAFIGGIFVATNKPQTFSIWLRTPKETTFDLTLRIGDELTGYEETTITATPEWQRFSVTLNPTVSGTTHVGVYVALSQPRAERIFYMDAALVEPGTKAGPYFDGDHPSCKWENEKGRSGSVELIEPELVENAVVIDSIVLNPITTGVAFNVYYTNDLTGSEEGKEMSEEEWEQKLWIHVPKSFVTSVKTTYVLPEPITAKFIKVEFSHLQGKPYEPGDYQHATTYKLFPDWVATPFLAEVAVPSFAAKRVGVIFNQLALAYKPVLDDLLQGPSNPEHPTNAPELKPPAVNAADPTTLRLIETTLNTYLKPPAQRANATTLLGSRASINAEEQAGYPVEQEPEFKGTPSSAVSGLDRQAVILEESTPVMFFWVTCRHEYKEQEALFENDRAYFAGISEIYFLRNQYSAVSDSNIYLEPGTDDTNTERSDFNVETYPVENEGIVYGEESVWFCY